MKLRVLGKLLLQIVMTTITWGCVCSVFAEPSKRSLNEVHERIETLKKQLSITQEAHKDTADALKDSEKAISSANKKLYEISQQQAANKKLLAQLEADSKATQQALEEQVSRLSHQLYQQYLHGEQSYLQMMLQSQQPSKIARDMHYFSYIAKARTEAIRHMRMDLEKINRLNEQTANTLQAVANLKQKQIEEKRILEQKKAEKSKILKSLSKQIAAQRNEIKKLRQDEKRLAQLVERLARAPKSQVSKKRIRQSSSEPAVTQESPSKEIVASNQVLPTDAVTGINFGALKGKLRLPVRGDVTNRFGSNREDSGISWKGLFIRANEGAEVKAVAGGRIVFADWLRGFGNLIIVDHGEGYMSLYGNNQAILKQSGDQVSAGDTIAYVGNSGGNETHGLYYELRRQSKPFDPLSWSSLN